MDNRNEKLTHNLIYNSISLNENENILVEVIGEDGLDLANEIIKQAKYNKLRRFKEFFNKCN